MSSVFQVHVKSITTQGVQTLVLDQTDAELIHGKRIVIVDDVISTGESLRAMEELVNEAGGIIVGKMAVLAEGDANDRPDITVLAADLSAGALTMAAKNAAENGVTTVDFARLDVTAPSPLDEVFDCIVSNPPYIRTDVVPTLAPELAYEPKMALDGGADGMDFYRAILTNYAQNLADGGAFLFEFGYDQEKDAAALAAAHRLGFAPLFDLGGRFRAARMTRQQRKV